MAVDNIRERIQITYADAATMQQFEEDNYFTGHSILLMLKKSREGRLMKILIFDDEKLACDRFNRMIKGLPDYEVVA